MRKTQCIESLHESLCKKITTNGHEFKLKSFGLNILRWGISVNLCPLVAKENKD